MRDYESTDVAGAAHLADVGDYDENIPSRAEAEADAADDWTDDEYYDDDWANRE